MSLITVLGVLSGFFVVVFTLRAYGDNTSSDGRQTRRQAIIEVWIGILIGFGLNFSMNLLLLPMVGAKFTALENFWLGMIYTSVSLLRGYAIRRWADLHIKTFSGWLDARIEGMSR